jgi:hypothetical protein
MKNHKTKFLNIVFLLTLLLVGCTSTLKPCQSIFKTIDRSLTTTGVLKQESNGFVYLKIEDAFIHNLVPYIAKQGFESPPYFGPGMIGAHITVINAEEFQSHGLTHIEECEQAFDFVPLSCQVVYPPHWPGVEAAYIVVIDAPSINQLRQKYGLTPTQFQPHITLGIKPKVDIAA